MVISYNFIAYCRKTSADSWEIGMKAIRGEVPLDIVIPEKQSSDEKVIGGLNTEGMARESSDSLEFVRYLRQLNAKPHDEFGYNNVVIRNVQNRLTKLDTDEEIRIQISYAEHREYYRRALYQIKMLGIFQNVTDGDTEVDNHGEYPSHSRPTQEQENHLDEKQTYKTTDTLKKLITFTQKLQRELTQTQKSLALIMNRVEELEQERQQYQALENMVQNILDHLNQLEAFDERIKALENSRQELHALQQTLKTFFKSSNQLTKMLMKESARDFE